MFLISFIIAAIQEPFENVVALKLEEMKNWQIMFHIPPKCLSNRRKLFVSVQQV